MLETLYQDALLLAFSAAGLMLGKKTTRECMKDDDMRLFLGNTLLYEIMPSSHAERSAAEPAAGAVCSALENAGGGLPLIPCLQRLFDEKESLLSLIEAYTDDNGYPPNGLCFGFGCLVMLLAGARRGKDGGFELICGQETAVPSLGEEILLAFSRYACDMSPESLSYAVLADVELWGRDLREIEGLQEKMETVLRDLQLLGVHDVMVQAGKDAKFASGL
ncbi:MAG: hypothetical protein IJ174_00885 [Clostridia bacterium]|nr:hypothetical protein [Clostridia bacterium]